MIFVYVYDHEGEAELTQFFGVEGLRIEKRLSGVSDASFFVSYRREDGSIRDNFVEWNFQEYNRIVITKMFDNTEKNLFEGYIAVTEAKSDGVTVTARCLLGLCEFCILKNGVDFRAMSMKNIVKESAKATGSDVLFLFDCGVEAVMSKKYEIGRSMLDILQDLHKAGYDFVVDAKTQTIRIDEMVGTDRRQTVQYVFDENIPQMSNIGNISITRSSKNIANVVVTKIASSPPYSVEDEESIEQYGRREKYITVNADEGVTPSRFLEKHKDSTPEIAFEVQSGDFWECELGDMVGLNIVGNPLLRYDGVTKIIGKSYTDGNLNTVQITTSMGEVRGQTLASILQRLDTRIASIERNSEL